MAYKPVENYGIIGDMHTAALVGTDGSIDWFCYPHFDSPSVFAAILDDEKGGSFRISSRHEKVKYKQFYWPETNVLVTRFMTPEGVAEVIDFMPVTMTDFENSHTHQLIRLVKTVRGSVHMRMSCRPAFNYAQTLHSIVQDPYRIVFHTEALSLSLYSDVSLSSNKLSAYSEFTLKEGEYVSFILQEFDKEDLQDFRVIKERVQIALNLTIQYWQNWLTKCTYRGRWREMVHRSALVLKLLTFKPTGAIVAAPTTSLPEGVGGERNWDYRYTWIRDAAFTLYGLMRIGFSEEAAAFMQWIENRCHEPKPDGSLQIMYSIDGKHDLEEKILNHLEGYRGSSPVRIGNNAYNQLQLDIYGELMDTVYIYNKYGSPISYDLWTHLTRLLNYVCHHWHEKDEGIWETRGGRRRFVYSMLMCWVALDRGLRLAVKRSFPADHNKWIKTRDLIYQTIMKEGWSDRRQAFVQFVGSETLDASNLIMPLVFFLSPTDPRMLKTLDRINRPPEKGGLVSDSLVYRYNIEDTEDGLKGMEGTFNICTFWLVEALTRTGLYHRNNLNEARLMFEKMLGYTNHLGLYSEEIGPCGEALGNFPQAFTHLALISAVFNLDRALG
jgi:GH15 family glucan-1,4-alpha-glucosidase